MLTLTCGSVKEEWFGGEEGDEAGKDVDGLGEGLRGEGLGWEGMGGDEAGGGSAGLEAGAPYIADLSTTAS